MPTETESKLARGELNELDAAKAVRDGDLPSPTKFGEFWLFDMRVTGTGAAWRDSIEEFAFRDPSIWLSDAFLERAAVVPIIFDHPEKSGLNSKEYRDRAIGNAMISYRKGEEVWCVARINDKDAALLMQTTHRSTSPGITTPKGSVTTATESGQRILAEALPLLLDHLAVCERGVWDKTSEEVSGIRLDSVVAKEQSKMTPEEEEKLKRERDDAVKRADSAEAKAKEYEDKARKDAEGKELEDKARKDAEETERAAVEKAENEKADKKRADRIGRHDSEKHEGKHDACPKCDSAEAEMEREDAKRKRPKSGFGRGGWNHDEDPKKDAAANVETVNAKEFEELKDARRQDAAKIENLTAQLATLNRQPTIEDSNEIAKAFHRADAAYQMLGEQAPKPLPGEMPIAYRRRVADGLRRHSDRWKDQPIHDSLAGPVFTLTEDAIFADALHAAKNPPINDSTRNTLIERTSTQNGKTRTEFFGSSSAAFAPFAAPVMSFKFKQPATAARG